MTNYATFSFLILQRLCMHVKVKNVIQAGKNILNSVVTVMTSSMR